MAVFEYKAIDAKGKNIKGIVECDSERGARAQLRDIGINAYEIYTTNSVLNKKTASSRRRHIKTSQLSIITRQLSVMIKAGMTVEEALGVTAKQFSDKNVRKILASVRSKILEGSPFSSALSQHPKDFSNLYVNTIEAGESAGKLEITLERLADYIQSADTIKSKVQTAAIYPAILTILSITITALLLTYVVPEVVKIFAESENELPITTEILIAISRYLTTYSWQIMLTIASMVLIIKKSLNNHHALKILHHVIHKIPLVNTLFITINTARFTKTLGIATASGVPILNALNVATNVLTSIPMKESTRSVVKDVREGLALSKAIAKTGAFPEIISHLIASGEASGRIDEVLDKCAEEQERQFEQMIGVAVSLLEPLILVSMGAVVLFIVTSILLPIFEINQFV